MLSTFSNTPSSATSNRNAKALDARIAMPCAAMVRIIPHAGPRQETAGNKITETKFTEAVKASRKIASAPTLARKMVREWMGKTMSVV